MPSITSLTRHQEDNMSDTHTYADDLEWSDITPLPQDDGGRNALATIAYTAEYREAMAYLRAVMAANEFSPRVLALTEHVISMNPAHYTVWLYRAKALIQLDWDLREEVEYLNEIALRHIKNYQIWHHRQLVITRLDSAEGEADFLAQMFEKDAKNYHVWSYRQWLVQHFGLWGQGEMEEVERLLRVDVRNNSAWNHRWFLVYGREGEVDAETGEAFEVSEDVWKREEDFVKDAIEMAPQNESPWNYLRGLYRKKEKDIAGLKGFAEGFGGMDDQKARSTHALDLLADIYGKEEDGKQEARKALDLLADRYDPIRANYWRYKKTLLDNPTNATTAAA